MRRLPLGAISLIFLAASLALAMADYAQQAQQQPQIVQQQQLDGYGNDQHQASLPSPSKSKKIQIVYIKVPLAKLKPSLAAGDNYNAGSDNSSSYGGQHDASKYRV